MNARAAPLLLVSLALLAACAPSGPAAPPAAPAAAAAQADPSRGGARKGSWIRAESEHKDLPIVWELRDDYTAPPGLSPQLVIVSQARETPFMGQIDASQSAEYTAREQRLLDTLAGHAELIAVLDWRQQHDWYFYADSSVTREQVAAALSDAVGRDIRIDLETDAGEFYATLMRRTGGKPATP